MDEFKNFVVTKAGTLKKYNGNEANVIIPEGIVGIAARAFNNIDGGPVSIRDQPYRNHRCENFCGRSSQPYSRHPPEG